MHWQGCCVWRIQLRGTYICWWAIMQWSVLGWVTAARYTQSMASPPNLVTVEKVKLQYSCWIQSWHSPMLTCLCHLFNNLKSAKHNKQVDCIYTYAFCGSVMCFKTWFIFIEKIQHLLQRQKLDSRHWSTYVALRSWRNLPRCTYT